MLETVQEINTELIDSILLMMKILVIYQVNLERHGAIRLGSNYELSLISRLFNVLGMQAVGYYDLSIADLPVHSTVFRPVAREDLKLNPFKFSVQY